MLYHIALAANAAACQAQLAATTVLASSASTQAQLALALVSSVKGRIEYLKMRQDKGGGKSEPCATEAIARNQQRAAKERTGRECRRGGIQDYSRGHLSLADKVGWFAGAASLFVKMTDQASLQAPKVAVQF